jgi:hypothetical protein
MTAPRRQRRGASALEFGLWLPVLVSGFAGMVDISWMMSEYSSVVRAARDGARVGVAVIEDEMVPPGSEMTVAAEAHASAVLAGVDMPCGTGCTVEATYDASTEFLTVEVIYPYEPLLGFLPLATQLRSSFTMRSQQSS